MKIAFYNIQNIFHRHIELVGRYRDENRSRWIAEFETLLTQSERTQKQYDRMRVLSHFLEFDSEGQMPYFTIKNTMGQLRLRKGLDGKMSQASHLSDWEGWAKIDSLPINEIAIRNKAKVIKEVDPDILVVLEVEDRASLVNFNQHFLRSMGNSPYREIVFLGTNDPFGRGIGVMAKDGFDLESIRTHVNDLDGKDKTLFDVDLQEYRFRTSSGNCLDLLCTHFIDKDGHMETFKEGQNRQSEYIARLLARRQRDLSVHQIFMGTLNAPIYSSSIAPIFKENYLRDITKHPNFMGGLDKGKDADYFRLGAYKMGVNIQQRDYLMLSKELFGTVESCGLVRKGMWFKKQPKWDIFGSITSERGAASEHPLLWCQLGV
ncbi:MAG: hypothetical protein NXH90_13175 [Flavobacteriaceae bacterium]|nr:hypothetical protein [Flavobacteriaceae bacterium]